MTRRWSSAVVVALSMGNLHALDLAADHPERVAAWVAIAPAIRGLSEFPPERQASFDLWSEDTGDDEGWGRYNKFSWLRDYPGFLDFFFDQVVPEEHSTKLIEDLTGWALGTDPETLVRAEVPATELVRYAVELRAMTSGSGTFSRVFARHDPMPCLWITSAFASSLTSLKRTARSRGPGSSSIDCAYGS